VTQRNRFTFKGPNRSPDGPSAPTGPGIIGRDPIAQEVMAMSDNDIAAYIERHGLSHMVEPERIARILATATSDDPRGDVAKAKKVLRPVAPPPKVGTQTQASQPLPGGPASDPDRDSGT
jgi:hypothetical protein